MLKIVSSESPKNFASRPTLSVLFFLVRKSSIALPPPLLQSWNFLPYLSPHPAPFIGFATAKNSVNNLLSLMYVYVWLAHPLQWGNSNSFSTIGNCYFMFVYSSFIFLSRARKGEGELGTQPTKFFPRKPYYSLQYFQINVWLERKCATCRCSGLTVRAMNFGQSIRVLYWLGSVCCGIEQDILSSRCSS